MTPLPTPTLTTVSDIITNTGIKSTQAFNKASDEEQNRFIVNALIGKPTYPVKNAFGKDVSPEMIVAAGANKLQIYPDLENAVNEWFAKNHSIGANMKQKVQKAAGASSSSSSVMKAASV